MRLEINITFPNHNSARELINLMTKSDWAWNYSVSFPSKDYSGVYVLQGDSIVTITNITCYESLNALRKMIKKVLKGDHQ